jgi:hypothetical protein
VGVFLALVVWVVSWFRVPQAVATSAARTWPGDMGTLDSVIGRMPRQEANEASRKLAQLAAALPKSEAIDDYAWREVARGDATIGAPPTVPDISAIRELLLHEKLLWEHRLEVGAADVGEARAVQMTVARTLVASALTKARANDPAAWDDLHAVWKLARSLDGNPQVMEQTAVLSMSRMINGVAWKFPLPAPAWLAEVHERDLVRPLLDAFQYQTADYWQSGAQMFPTKSLADSVEHDRRIAEALFHTRRCDVTTAMNELGTDLTSVWRRAFRYRAEREGSANALRVREGKPVVTTSQCEGSAWAFDGKTLRFSSEIATPPPDRPMPLVLTIRQ